MSYSQAAAAHLDRLRSRHQSLDDDIDRLSRSSSVEGLDLVSLKKQRLRLKETITQLEQGLAQTGTAGK